MNDRKFTDKLFLMIAAVLVTAGCSNYKDQQITPPENLPESVIKVMSDAFPDATDATFQSIEKEKLYEVYYKLNGNPFYAALNTRKILSVYRMHGAIPDSMQQALPARSVTGGAADAYKEPVPQPAVDKVFSSKYTWNNNNYLLTWIQNKPSDPVKYMLRLEPYVKFSYPLTKEELTTLPGPAVSFIEREKLRFSGGTVSITEKNEKQYFVHASTASSTNYSFTFDGSGKLINTIYRAEAFYYDVKELPGKMQTFIQNSPAFSGMKIAEGYKFSDPAGTGYVISMQGTEENCWLNFDQDGNFVSMTYQTALER
ncbi:hypothetical protein [Dyadobacter fermentans]|uniref:Lipoprotein n=1 Tax=Dyadobacter fermentans (strain ATCC 700827 / DSM 18053 / CIP 107007 / KCTC 52180 / NS114) TaxID=471854 RepID=C6W664_DYAFD|nr:hypothetical protein [Dyadobacter fermentans]ACT92544.1 hypothetical protein Dfer_1296 [Dyadobacter fermentans DSM 18053]